MGTRSDNDGMFDRKNCENIKIINNLGLTSLGKGWTNDFQNSSKKIYFTSIPSD